MKSVLNKEEKMFIIFVLSLAIVISTISYGAVKAIKGDMGGKKKIKKALGINLSLFIPVACAFLILLVPGIAQAATKDSSSTGLAYIGAGLSTGLACIGTGYGVGAVGSSALGTISEDPKMFGKTLIYVGLAEGVALYGLIISLLILFV